MIAGGVHMTCIMTGAKVACWGLNVVGQLGRGNTADIGVAVTDMTNLNFISFAASLANLGVADLSVGHDHACVMFSNGSVTCWGGNSDEQLGGPFPAGSPQGDDSLEMVNLPPIVFAPTIATIQVVQIAAKPFLTCGI